jgi:hypothetical protein
MPAQFAEDDVRSTFTYPAGYRPKPVVDQIARLRALFSELKDASSDETLPSRQPLPDGAQTWFAIPRWDLIAPTYNAALDTVLATIGDSGGGTFVNCLDGELGSDRLRQHPRTRAMERQLREQQAGHGILLVPAQFGLRHRGHSVRQARAIMERTGHEFGLGAVAVGCMLLTHPERLQHAYNLWIDCAGDEYDDPDDDDRFSYAPGFNFAVGGVGFEVGWFDAGGDDCGSASGFLPHW